MTDLLITIVVLMLLNIPAAKFMDIFNPGDGVLEEYKTVCVSEFGWGFIITALAWFSSGALIPAACMGLIIGMIFYMLFM